MGLAVACGGSPAKEPASPAPRPAGATDPPVSAPTAAPATPVASARKTPSEPPASAQAPEASATAAGPGPAPSSADAEPGEAPAPLPAPTQLPRGTTVLHIGDSFAGALGIDLNREFKEAGVRGILRYETATYIPTWASGKKLEQYLQQFNPDLVLVTLGANELLIPDPKEREPTIHRLVKHIGDRPCVWVAPPLWKGARPDLLETIRTACAPCLYLDSGALVPDLPRARDHIHPSIEARKTWAKAVVGWLAAHRSRTADRPWGLTQ